MKHWTILAVELCKYRVYIYYNIDSILLFGLSCMWKSNLWEVPVNPGAVFSSDFQDEKLLTRLVPRIVKLIRHFWAFNVIVQLLILWVCNLKCVWEFHLFTEAATRFITVICWMSHLLHVTYRINHRAYLVIIFQYVKFAFRNWLKNNKWRYLILISKLKEETRRCS